MRSKLIKIFNIIFVLVFIFVIYNAILNNTENDWNYNPVLIIFGIILYIVFFKTIYKWLTKKKEIKNKTILIILLITICLQLIVGILFKVSPAWDVEKLFNMANDITEINNSNLFNFFKEIKISNINLDYFYQYKNNLGMEIILLGIFKLADIIKIINYYDLSMLINIVLIDLSILFTYLSAKKIYKKNEAIIVFIFLIAMTPVYLFVPIIYTDTYSMLFTILVYYLFLNAEEKEEKKYIYYILISIILAIGIIIKPTVGIIGIAIIIINFLYKRFKDTIILSVILISITSTIIIIFNYFVPKLIFKNWNQDEYNRKKLPLSNWIVMGLQEKGTFNIIDNYNITNIDGYDGKKQYANGRIKDNLKHIKTTGINNFLTKKINETWGEGTYFAQVMLNIYPVNKGIHHEFIVLDGNKTEFYKYFSQSQHIAMLILIALSGFTIKDQDKNILKLTVFGIFLFFVVWEARSRYLVNYLPIMSLLTIQGIKNIYLIKEKILKIKSKLK